MSLTSITLSACQFFYMAVFAINLAFNSPVAQQLAPNRSLSTLPYLCLMGTTAGLVLLLPNLFDRLGYRKMFVLGAVAGAFGGLLASLALLQRSFWLFCCAGLLIGLFQATAMYYRYAAADSVATEHKSTAIAWVLNGGIVSALLSKYIADASDGDACEPACHEWVRLSGARFGLGHSMALAWDVCSFPAHGKVDLTLRG